MSNILTSSVIDGRLNPKSGQTKDYKTIIYCFFS